MNDFINAHPLERKERIAFDLMLKIAHFDSHCKSEPDAELNVQNSDQLNNPDHDTRGKDYWLDLYKDCLTTVKHQKCKK